MHPTIAIITFSFNEYDFPKKPYFVDDDIEYICVTDHPEYCEGTGWKPIVDSRFAHANPIYASYYVRYHAHEYTNADIILIIDGSLRIATSVMPLINPFIESKNDIGICVGGFINNLKKIYYWNINRKRDGNENYRLAETALRDNCAVDIRGTTASTFKLMRNNRNAIQFNEYVWALCLQYGIDGIPNRLDEVFVDIALNGLYKDTSVFAACSQLLYRYPFQYCKHGTNLPHSNVPHFGEYMLRGKPIHPLCVGPEYPTSYKYSTEAMLLTKYMEPPDLEYWLDWHLNKIGFEHIHVFGNELSYDAKAICDQFDGRVSFENVIGIPRQYKLYDRYIAMQSEAEWVMPIDDDEFLVFDETTFNTVADAIRYYDGKHVNMEMLAVRWLHLFPESFHTERNGMPLMEYNCCQSPEIASMFERAGDNCVKCIVHRYGWVHYEETVENPAGGHVPKHSNATAATGFDGTRITGYCYTKTPADTADEKIRLVHCRYWGYSEYCKKYREDPVVRVSDASHRVKSWKFDAILDSIP